MSPFDDAYDGKQRENQSQDKPALALPYERRADTQKNADTPQGGREASSLALLAWQAVLAQREREGLEAWTNHGSTILPICFKAHHSRVRVPTLDPHTANSTFGLRRVKTHVLHDFNSCFFLPARKDLLPKGWPQ
ncbi:hypothetical protein PAMP_007848 [Pampus punctatissimus]